MKFLSPSLLHRDCMLHRWQLTCVVAMQWHCWKSLCESVCVLYIYYAMLNIAHENVGIPLESKLQWKAQAPTARVSGTWYTLMTKRTNERVLHSFVYVPVYVQVHIDTSYRCGTERYVYTVHCTSVQVHCTRYSFREIIVGASYHTKPKQLQITLQAVRELASSRTHAKVNRVWSHFATTANYNQYFWAGNRQTYLLRSNGKCEYVMKIHVQMLS